MRSHYSLLTSHVLCWIIECAALCMIAAHGSMIMDVWIKALCIDHTSANASVLVQLDQCSTRTCCWNTSIQSYKTTVLCFHLSSQYLVIIHCISCLIRSSAAHCNIDDIEVWHTAVKCTNVSFLTFFSISYCSVYDGSFLLSCPSFFLFAIASFFSSY